jgi:hypothetical protein
MEFCLFILRTQELNNTSSYNQQNKIRILSFIPKIVGFEAAIWISSLLFLAFVVNPGETHFTLCPLNNFGFNYCPGCGIGNSVSYLLHGNIYNSLLSHSLGLFALIIIVVRIINLIKSNWRNYGKHITTNALS